VREQIGQIGRFGQIGLDIVGWQMEYGMYVVSSFAVSWMERVMTQHHPYDVAVVTSPFAMMRWATVYPSASDDTASRLRCNQGSTGGNKKGDHLEKRLSLLLDSWC
jgi:hypothetical protein